MMEPYQIKRFIEWWIGDPIFRKRLMEDPWKTVHEYQVDVDPEAVSILYNEDIQDHDSLPRNVHPGVKAYLTEIRKRKEYGKKLRKRAGTSNKAFAKWRLRQMARLAGQDHSRDSNRNPHMHYAIELTNGCSIKCDYCGLDAGPLKAAARFTHENEKLFYDILRSFIRFFGEGCDTGLLYWATEPLDNPDYEKYLKAFYDVFGKIPGTTTAGWFRDVGRTRRLLKQIKQRDGFWDRFSINSADHLSFCMKTFSARELENVGLVINHPGALRGITATGRGRRILSSIEGTSACVTGFLVSLPNKSIELISPCIEPRRWPLGYRILAKSPFKDATDMLNFMFQCQTKIMGQKITDHYIPKLREDFRISKNKRGQIILTSTYRKFTVPEGLATEMIKTIDGKRTVKQIANRLGRKYGYDAACYAIETWWDEGFLEDFQKPT